MPKYADAHSSLKAQAQIILFDNFTIRTAMVERLKVGTLPVTLAIIRIWEESISITI